MPDRKKVTQTQIVQNTAAAQKQLIYPSPVLFSSRISLSWAAFSLWQHCSFSKTKNKKQKKPQELSAQSLQLCLTLGNPMDGQPPLSVRLSWQEYRSRSPFPSPGDLPEPGIEPTSPAAPALQVESSPLSHQGRPPPAGPKKENTRSSAKFEFQIK